MAAFSRYRTGRWLKVVLGLAATTGLCAPTAATAVTPLDTARATGSGPPFDSVNITAQGTPTGQSVSGTAAVSAFGLNLSGPVTCLSVTGPDQGAGTPTSPTTAILNFQDPRGVLTVQLVDNGGNGADDITVFAGGRAPSDCSSPVPGGVSTVLSQGRAVVFDAAFPTSKDQCKDGGWRKFPSFKSQGECVSFVETGR